jgi:hypothetical protein
MNEQIAIMESAPSQTFEQERDEMSNSYHTY